MLDKHKSMWRFPLLIMLVASAILTGCSTSVIVKGNLPTPLVERMNLKGSLVYTDKFNNYVYKESERKRALSSLDFTDAQTQMFNQVFGSLVTLVPVDAPQKDLNIEPEILEIQYTAPRETKINQYEIWIKYRIKLSDSVGDKIADWIIKGYGKTPTAMLSSASSAFSAATNVALRDVGAQLSIGFPKQSKIKALVGEPVRVDDTESDIEENEDLDAQTAAADQEPNDTEEEPSE